MNNLLTRPFGIRVRIDWVRSIELKIRLRRCAVKHFVGADVHKRDVELLTCKRNMLGAKRVHQQGALWLTRAAVHVGPSSAMNYVLRP